MIDKPSDEWTEEDWNRLRLAAFALSDKVMRTLEDQGSGDFYSPQVAGYALIIAMGRVSGKNGFRGVSIEEAWKLWTDAASEREFRLAFEYERAGEN